jgi:alpha-mannosidase
MLYHNQPRVELETTIDNRAEDHRLRVLFPTGFATNISHADAQFGITRREHLPVNPEEFSIEVPSAVHPMQRGVTILDGGRGFTLATVDLPEYELKAEEPGTLGLTLLRSVGRLSGGDLLTRPGGEAGWIADTPEAQCLGEYTFRYAIIPHTAEDFHDYGYLNEQLESFRLPVRAMRRGGEPAFDLAQFGIELQPTSLVLSGFKPAEDGQGMILRGYNPTDRAMASRIRTARPVQKVFRAGLNERNHEVIPVTGKHTVQFTVEPRAIFSLRLVF